MPDTPTPQPTPEQALSEAARVLQLAEAERTMESGDRLTAIADRWIAIASLRR